MDQATLVKEQFVGGKSLLARLQREGVQLSGACWARTDADSEWFLYLVSPSVEVEGTRSGYQKVRAAISQMDQEGWDEFERVNPFDVKLIGPSSELARAIAGEYNRYSRLGLTPRSSIFGWTVPSDVTAAYLYPATLFTTPAAPSA